MVLIDLRHRRAAVLAEQGGESQKFSLELPPFGESGLFEDMAASVKLVREALAENGVRDKKCALLLPNSLAESREFRVPRLSRAETLDYIRTNYVDSIGLSEDRLLDYIVVREEGDFCHVLAVSVRREVLRQCGEFSRGLGLRCVSVQLHASAAWKYMRQLQAGNDRACWASASWRNAWSSCSTPAAGCLPGRRRPGPRTRRRQTSCWTGL